MVNVYGVSISVLCRLMDTKYQLLFPSLKIPNALDVFLRLKPRKYKYKEYITITGDVLFLSNLICILD